MLKKLFIILAILITASIVSAVPQVTFTWDANTEPDLAGYRLYFADASGAYVFGGNSSANFLAEIPCPANDTTCCTWTAPSMSGTGHFYVATAYDTAGFESLPSNEVNSLPPGQVKKLNLSR
jgi:hypothetical protein